MVVSKSKWLGKSECYPREFIDQADIAYLIMDKAARIETSLNKMNKEYLACGDKNDWTKASKVFASYADSVKKTDAGLWREASNCFAQLAEKNREYANQVINETLSVLHTFNNTHCKDISVQMVRLKDLRKESSTKKKKAAKDESQAPNAAIAEDAFRRYVEEMKTNVAKFIEKAEELSKLFDSFAVVEKNYADSAKDLFKFVEGAPQKSTRTTKKKAQSAEKASAEKAKAKSSAEK
ncbi:unnamed protein product [Caenorhabditis auriculariae]|uniref:BAR domain-containing protein n=1 Tax=Caenorhabditis auriculariae TaxID=2777116 RepID=A0A8S1GUA3_9PELO|nr:unnamed protein product [Caenorhabditis auriculariae]